MREIQFTFLLFFWLFGYLNTIFSQKINIKLYNEVDSLVCMRLAPVQFQLLDNSTSQYDKAVITVNTDSLGFLQNPYPDLLTQIKIDLPGYKIFIDTINNIRTGKIQKEYYFELKNATYELTPSVITGQYSATNSNKSIHRIRVIDSKRIEMQGAVNLADLLSKELNIRINQDNAIGQSSMSILGMSGQNVKILIDGVPVIGRLDGNLDLSQINLNNIERIEIIEGPMAVVYGTDALAGAINLITKKNFRKKFQVTTSLYYETVGKYNIDASLSTRLGKQIPHNLKISLGRNFFDGWSAVPSNRYQTWRPKEQILGALTYDFSYKKWKLNLNSQLLNETLVNKGIPTITSSRAYAFDEYYVTRRWDNTLQLNGFIQPHRYLDFIFGYSYYDRLKSTFYKDLVTLNKTITPNVEQQDSNSFQRIMARGVYSMNKENSKFNYQIGYDNYIEVAEGARITDASKNMAEIALFGTVEYRPIKKIIIRPGFRLAYNSKYKAPPIPSLNIKYDVNDKISIRASYAKGFRTPSLKELFLDFVDASHNIFGNPNLKAEYSHYASISGHYQFITKKSFTNIEVSTFYNTLSDRIFLAQAQNNIEGNIGKDNQVMPFTYINLAGFQTFGLQTNLKYKRERCGLETGFSYIGNKVSTPTINSTINFTPELSTQFYYDIKKIKTKLALFHKFNGRIQSFSVMNQNEIEPYFISSYHTIDITVTKYFVSNKIQIIIGAKNLGNIQNIVAQSGGGAHSSAAPSQPVAMGRSLFLSLRGNF